MANTKRLLASAEVGLGGGCAAQTFLERGYEQVTVDEVAASAGVSRRTAYRHFPNKYDLVFDHLQRWLECFEGVLETRTADESPRSIIRRGVLAVAKEIEDTAEAVLEALGVFATTESLTGRNARSQQQWRDTYAGLLRADAADQTGQLEVDMVAGALVAMTDALCTTWAAAWPEVDMVDLTEQALDIFDPRWPSGSR